MKISICGIAGRMGRMVLQCAVQMGHTVAGGIEHPDNKLSGKEIEFEGFKVPVRTSLKDVGETNVVIDFSSSEGTGKIADECSELKVPLVTGTTGLDDEVREKIFRLSRIVPVVQSPNMSPGVNLLFWLTELASRALSQDYDVEIMEVHHRMKADAPSGTAMRLLEIISNVRKSAGINPVSVFGREGKPGARKPEEIGVMALRGGGVVGEHTVYFIGTEERIELTHRAGSRMAFARGAIIAAEWVVNKEPGLYSMFDVLGIGKT